MSPIVKRLIHPALTLQDKLVLENLLELPPSTATPSKDNMASFQDARTAEKLKALNDVQHPDFTPTVFTLFEDEDLPGWIREKLVQPYRRMAGRVVRHPTDIVFLTHLLVYCCVNLPSAIFLFRHFTYIHGIAHVMFTLWCIGPFTLLMHNHIHNNGVLAKDWANFDFYLPYILEPLMGHTWDSYYYHHVKHHHVEGNGPDDLSSTLFYQRDSLVDFLKYFSKFFLFTWIELPLYFWRKKRYALAVKAFTSEFASFAFMGMAYRMHHRSTIFTLVIPFVLLRIGLMIGNWGQHALIDEDEPDSDLRSSITLIDVASNRHCFNDGYHTAHHLNPRRHWRDQPLHFVQSKQAYADGRALVFHNIDYLWLTITLLRKDYLRLADCLVPIGGQIGMSRDELAAMLRTKTRKFTTKDVEAKFGKKADT